ncbi:CARDB domain-containing protein [Halosolutus amylolyticus]|uniref:CARDB domain-containing protein n=1 Tax=Halosolutus amylolyticus TaxID=2932267 RepID=A0ABD5PKX4_9EURY|nr:CARDB domain-containing protein [Halosolutus amylolyticus]
MKKQTSVRILLCFGLIVIAGTVFFAGSAAATASLEEMNGDGTEDDPYIITDVEELQAMNENPDAHYVLGNDVDASETETWDAGAGFEPIGDESPFDGSFDGQNHTITGLTIDRPSDNNVGLFGRTTGTIKNVYLEDIDVRGGERNTGTLVGENAGDVKEVSVTGSVKGEGREVGGLIGFLEDGDGTVERSGADVDVSGENAVGGLIGGISSWKDYTITNTYAKGDIEASDGRAGGLVGFMREGDTIRIAYATGDVTGTEAGGIAGANGGFGHDGGTISTAFATGELSGDEIGAINGTGRSWHSGTYSDTFWDRQTTGVIDGQGTGSGLTTAEMTGTKAETNLNGFGFGTFWTLTDEYPVLEWQVEAVSVSLSDDTVGAGEQTSVTVTLTLDDGSTVTASEVADYDAGGIVDVDAGVVDAQQQGTAEITATIAGESDTAELEITEPPKIELAESEFDADAIVEGSTVTASATYKNDGGPGSHTAELIADGEAVDTQTVSLDADEETTIEFEWTPHGAIGTEYDLAIDDTDVGSISVVEPGTVTLEDARFPDRVGSGSPYEFTVDLENEADETVIDTITYELDDEVVATESVTVEPDGSEAILGHETDTDVGLTIAHAVTGHNETIEGTSDVTDPPEFEISDIETPDELEAGEEFDLTVTVENTGGVEGTQTVTVSDAEGEVASEELTIESAASETITVSLSDDGTGGSEFRVATEDDEMTEAVTITEADDGTDEPDDSNDSDGLPGFGALTATLALVAVLALLGDRRPDQ